MPRVNLSKLLILIASASVLLGAKECKGPPGFEWHPKYWAGDAETQSMVRTEEGDLDLILCSDSDFDSMICMHNSEPRKAREAYHKLINECERWKSPAAKAAAESAFKFME